MLNRETLSFLKQLKNPANNSKAWVDAHRDQRDRAVADLEALAASLIKEVSMFDPKIKRAGLVPNACVTRLNRDVRFHGGPSFKHHAHVVFNHRGKKSPTAYYFVQVEWGRCSVGAGVYSPDSRELLRFREGVASDFSKFEKIIGAKAFTSAIPSGLQTPERAKTIPRGFRADDPAAEYLRYRGFYVREALTDRELTQQATLKKIIRVLRAAKPLVDFLNDAYESPAKARSGRTANPPYPR